MIEVGAFALAALVIALAGVYMTRVADTLADRTGLGEAVVGGILLGAATSLSGVVTSVSAAIDGLAPLAVSNAVGGICAQTVLLVVADLTYRRANLEHAAADEKNMLQAALLVLLLGVALAGYVTPQLTVWALHPVSFILIAAYIFGVRTNVALQERPSWKPRQTSETQPDGPEEEAMQEALMPLLLKFAGLAAVLAGAGYVVAKTGAAISADFGISQTVVGALLTATATSLPELVTTVAAVRRGALQLAVGGIVGGNTFDVLFLTISDFAYRDGSIYAAMGSRDALLLVAGVVMTAILLMGLILRDRKGIGFEGISILAVYAAVIALQIYLG
ncbi:Inner membrane protein YrbG [Methyloligella halotolerans]|uniref:Inner membrane protein YrbG n=1 Tax=Methyloligella halotolerans TaxID=1177755 RepID=A0A1E2RWZ9_9HYPH|nr:sodium:calcium antiporter [Methyloligella halotolerans]ODA66733.1 Inner membrane protein YrbG [Methyloligella halotolerans]